ncbi:hypothetical protein Tco_1027844 [Tanacetum coccineum]
MAKISRKVPTSNLVRNVQERQGEVDFKGDAKFAQGMKTGAVSDLAKSKSLSEQPAKRVAEKMETELGDLGGYAIRFEDVTGHSTKI